MDEERERIVDPDATVMQGEDDVPRQPSPPLDPYTPAPGPRPGARGAFTMMRWLWLPILIVAALILWVALR